MQQHFASFLPSSLTNMPYLEKKAEDVYVNLDRDWSVEGEYFVLHAAAKSLPFHKRSK